MKRDLLKLLYLLKLGLISRKCDDCWLGRKNNSRLCQEQTICWSVLIQVCKQWGHHLDSCTTLLNHQGLERFNCRQQDHENYQQYKNTCFMFTYLESKKKNTIQNMWLTSVWNLLSHKYNDVLIGLNGSKSMLTFFSFPSSVIIVPQ